MFRPMEKFGILLVLAVWTAASTGQKAEGTLRGTVLDATNARIPSARIMLLAMEGTWTRSVSSDGRGLFRVDDLAPGKYRVVVRAAGFADAVAEVTIEVSSGRDIAVTLRPSAVDQKIHVQAVGSSIATQPIDLSSQTHKSVITARDLSRLPLADRSFANIAYLAPGTEPVEPSDPTKARITADSSDRDWAMRSLRAQARERFCAAA